MATSGSTRTTLISPFQYFADPTRGRPIFNGFIFIGRVDGDPTNTADQIPVQVICECGGSPVNVTQPIRTGPGGLPIYNGSPAQIVVCRSNYSLTLQDNNRVQVYHSPNVQSGFVNQPITHTTLAAAMADDNSSRQLIRLLERGGAEFRRAANQAEYDRFPDTVRFTDNGGIQWVLDFNGRVSVQNIITNADDISSDTVAFATAFEGVLIQVGREVLGWRTTTLLPENFNIAGVNASYSVGGQTSELQSLIRCYVTPFSSGNNAVPVQRRVSLERVAFNAESTGFYLFDGYSLRESWLQRVYARSFNIIIRGNTTLLTTITHNVFLNCERSFIRNRDMTAPNITDSTITNNYISGSVNGSVQANESLFAFDIQFPNLSTIKDNFIDFWNRAFNITSGRDNDISGNNIDFCFLGCRIFGLVDSVISNNNFTHINKSNASRWDNPTPDMVSSDWTAGNLLSIRGIRLASNTLDSDTELPLMLSGSGYEHVSSSGNVWSQGVAVSVSASIDPSFTDDGVSNRVEELDTEYLRFPRPVLASTGSIFNGNQFTHGGERVVNMNGEFVSVNGSPKQEVSDPSFTNNDGYWTTGTGLVIDTSQGTLTATNATSTLTCSLDRVVQNSPNAELEFIISGITTLGSVTASVGGSAPVTVYDASDRGNRFSKTVNIPFSNISGRTLTVSFTSCSGVITSIRVRNRE